MLIFPAQISWKSLQQLSSCYMWTNRHSRANKHTFSNFSLGILKSMPVLYISTVRIKQKISWPQNMASFFQSLPSFLPSFPYALHISVSWNNQSEKIIKSKWQANFVSQANRESYSSMSHLVQHSQNIIRVIHYDTWNKKQ